MPDVALFYCEAFRKRWGPEIERLPEFSDMEVKMKALLYIIALWWIVSGTFLIVFTEKTREVFKKMFPAEKVKWLSVVPFIVGVVLIIGAFFNRGIFWLALVLGILGILKGVYLYMAPPQQTRALMDWWYLKAKPETIRFFGLITFVIGIALFSYLR